MRGVGYSLPDWGRWDHYVQFTCPKSGITTTERCLGLATAEAIANSKLRNGFWRVKVFQKVFSRKKERHSVRYSGIQR